MYRKDYKYQFKLAIIGNSNVGKSSINQHFTREKTRKVHEPTIGTELEALNIRINGVQLNLHIWDTAGSAGFRKTIETFVDKTAGILIVYDVTNRESFRSVDDVWIPFIMQSAPLGISLILVGNKTDKKKDRVVSFEEGQAKAEEYGMLFAETTTRGPDNKPVVKCFTKLVKQIQSRIASGDLEPIPMNGITQPQEKAEHPKASLLTEKKKSQFEIKVRDKTVTCCNCAPMCLIL